MKVLVCLYLVMLTYLFHNEKESASLWVSGQYFDDPTVHFEYLPLDLVHRGSFNISECIHELLNCWEIIKPDLICSYWVLYESVCGLMRTDCSDRDGFSFRDIVPIYEAFCRRQRRSQLP